MGSAEGNIHLSKLEDGYNGQALPPGVLMTEDSDGIQKLVVAPGTRLRIAYQGAIVELTPRGGAYINDNACLPVGSKTLDNTPT